MLQPAGAFRVEGVPAVTLYPDHASATRFYAVPAAPRVARDAGGTPQISFLRYAPKPGHSPGLGGGQVTVTTDLALTAGEHALVERALVARLAPRPAPGVPPPPPPRVELLSPEWLDGSVEVELLQGLVLAGTPSMIGANECSLQAALSAEGAALLAAAWSRGLPDATIRYRTRVQAASTATASTAVEAASATAEPGRAARASSSAAVEATVTRAHPLPLDLAGPIGLSAAELSSRMQEIRL